MATAWLTDLGLARSIATGSRYTRSGQALGTPAYMSPEQARGETSGLTPTTDVWSLGCVLYELLAGRRAFDGDTPAEVIGAVLTREPTPLARCRADLPAHLETVVRVALARSPRHRHPSAHAFRDDLERVLRGERPATWPRRRGSALVAASALVVAAAAIAWQVMPDPFGSPPPAGASVDVAAGWAARARARQSADPGEAAEWFARAIAATRDPDAADGWRVDRGLLLWAVGRSVDARVEWARIPSGGRAGERARLYEALEAFCRSTTGGEPEARECLATAEPLAAVPGAVGRLATAILAIPRGRWAQARETLAGLPGWEAALMRGYVEGHAPDGAAEQAGRELQRAVTDGVPLAWAWNERGVLRAAAGDPSGAIACYDAALRLEPGGLFHLVNRGVARLQAGDCAGAESDFTHALDVRRDLFQGWNGRAEARGRLGRLGEAVADQREAIRLAPGNATVLANLGILLADTGDGEAAVRAFDEAIARDSRHAGAWFGRARAWILLERFADALADLDRAAALGLQGAEFHIRRGAVRESLDDEPGARADYDAALALAPGDPGALANRGDLRARMGDLEGGLADLAAATAVEAAPPEAFAMLGAAREAAGDRPGAAAAYREFLKRAPDHPDAAEIRRSIESVR